MDTSLGASSENQIDSTAKAPTTTQPDVDNFAFVCNVSKLVGSSEFLLAPGHVLRRASQDELSIIHEVLKGPVGGMSSAYDFPWENRRGPDGSSVPLAQDEWRYYVIGFRGWNDTIVELEQALAIAEEELQIAFTVARNLHNGVISHSGRLFQFLDEARWLRTKMYEVTPNGAEQISRILIRLRTIEPEFANIKRVAQQFVDLYAVPPKSPLRFLGYFGILESLLTHKPDPDDPHDSITKQVRRKIALLDHRWSPRIDYSVFGNAKPDTVWTSMYAYRSCLAHGSEPDFKSKNLKVLVESGQAMALLRYTVKAIARQFLIEPQLLSALRDC